jgi:hypothetical protein
VPLPLYVCFLIQNSQKSKLNLVNGNEREREGGREAEGEKNVENYRLQLKCVRGREREGGRCFFCDEREYVEYSSILAGFM